MNCKCNEIIEYLEKEILLIEELLEHVIEGKRSHLVLDVKKDSFKKVKDKFLE